MFVVWAGALYFAYAALPLIVVRSGPYANIPWNIQSLLVTWIAPVVVPLVAGATIVWFSRRNLAFGSRSPAWTSTALLPVFAILAFLSSPGGDLLGAAVGGLAAIAVTIAVYVALRRRITTTESA